MFVKLLTIAILSAAAGSPAIAGSTAQRDAPTVRFYDSRGNSVGSATTDGNTARFYDSRGNSIGSATRNSGRHQ